MQLLPHLPQFEASLDVSTHAPLQLACPPSQVQRALWQDSFAAHTKAHAPQLLLSLCRLTQAPAHALRPVAQLELQTPFEQTCPCAQALPQAPQLALALLTSTQAPRQS